MKAKWFFLVLLLASLTGCIVAAPPPQPAYAVSPYGYYYPRAYYSPAPVYVWPLPGVWWNYHGGRWGYR